MNAHMQLQLHFLPNWFVQDIIATKYIDETLDVAMAHTSMNTISKGDYQQVCVCVCMCVCAIPFCLLLECYPRSCLLLECSVGWFVGKEGNFIKSKFERKRLTRQVCPLGTHLCLRAWH